VTREDQCEIGNMIDAQAFVTQAYSAFNERRIEDALALMDADVEWPNGMEGGTVHGHVEVREYWTRQWGLIDPRVEPRHVTVGPDDRIYVDVHQVVRDLGGVVLRDQMVQHVYTLEKGRAKRMEIREGGRRAGNGKKNNEE
jgi:ketosteroid isomerase-like protein